MATPTTQTKRRLTFGLNVLIAVSAATALAVLLCWLSFNSPKRWDFTHTRQYSLSEQTLTVLSKGLTEPHEAVTLFNRPAGDLPGRAEQVERANDLVDEYARRSANLRVEHINPDIDTAKVTALFDRIKKRYAKQFEPLTAAINKGVDAMKVLKESPKTIVPLMTKLQQDPELTNPTVREYLQRAVQPIASIEAALERSITAVTSEPSKQLPNYSGSIAELRTKLTEVDTKLLAVISQQLKQTSVTEGATPGVREQLLKIQEEIDRARKPIQDALVELRSVKSIDDYEKLRDQLSVPDTILIMGPTRETVVQLDEMFRQVDPKEREALSKEGAPELAFLGEERLTGALLSLSMKVRPKVVFVYSNPRNPPIGPRGNYNSIADRLSKLNFVVDQWTPGPRMGPMGQPSPPAPPPAAEPGQKMVWVLLAADPSNDMRDPMAGRIAEQAVSTVTERLSSGDSGLVMLSPSPTSRFNPTSPIVQALELFRIKPLMDRVILREVAVKAGEKRPTSWMEVNTWPDAIAITKAIGGLNANFRFALPLEEIASKDNPDVKTFPLVRVTLPGLWAEQDFEAAGGVKRTPEKSAEAFTIGMAAQTKTNRLVVIGDPIWATDEITTQGIFGAGTADIGGALYPGNTELFVNSVYWLSGLEDMIAASPRSQDIRRVQSMTQSTYNSVKWSMLAGMPVLAFFLGVAVYFVRRRA